MLLVSRAGRYDDVYHLDDMKCLSLKKEALSYCGTRFTAVSYVTDALYGKLLKHKQPGYSVANLILAKSSNFPTPQSDFI